MEQQDVIIELREMSKSFKVKNGVVHALDKIDLKINRGEIFGIIGMSGAGKSTLVRCINLLERPTEGQVLFDGQDLTVLKPAELRQARRSMGMIFQQFNLFFLPALQFPKVLLLFYVLLLFLHQKFQEENKHFPMLSFALKD